MPLTPDSELELLFPAEFIPQEVRDALHQDLHVSATPNPIAYDTF